MTKMKKRKKKITEDDEDDDDDEDDEEEDKKRKEKMKEDIDALFADDKTISEDFRAKASTIFEARVLEPCCSDWTRNPEAEVCWPV